MKKVLNEAPLHFSQTAADQIIQNPSIDEMTIKIPLGEAFNMDSRHISNGVMLWLFSLYDWKNNQRMSGAYEAYWDPKTRRFKKNFVSFIERHFKMPIFFLRQPLRDLGGGVGTVTNQDYNINFDIQPNKKQETFVVVLNMMLPNSKIPSVVEHELKHITQALNTTALEYGRWADRQRHIDFDNIPVLDLREIMGMVDMKPSAFYGVGKHPPDVLQQPSVGGQSAAGSSAEETINYFSDPREYESWMAELVDHIASNALRHVPELADEAAFFYAKSLFQSDRKNMHVRQFLRNANIPIQTFVRTNFNSFNTIAMNLLRLNMNNLVDRNDHSMRTFFYVMRSEVPYERRREFIVDLISFLSLIFEKVGKRLFEIESEL